MITYKVTPLFDADFTTLYPVLFGDKQHCSSVVEGNIGQFSFEDDTVTPINLGPLVIVQVVTPSE